jgi:predicted  nucleic acid-binding Zn-ribbon protein
MDRIAAYLERDEMYSRLRHEDEMASGDLQKLETALAEVRREIEDLTVKVEAGELHSFRRASRTQATAAQGRVGESIQRADHTVDPARAHRTRPGRRPAVGRRGAVDPPHAGQDPVLAGVPW